MSSWKKMLAKAHLLQRWEYLYEIKPALEKIKQSSSASGGTKGEVIK